jgi:hypothetical protein
MLILIEQGLIVVFQALHAGTHRHRKKYIE